MTEVTNTEIGPIGFVWTEGMPVNTWAGGSETYTFRHMAELRERGYHSQLITLGDTAVHGLEDHGISVLPLKNKDELGDLDATLIFVTDPVYGLKKLQKPSHVILHIPAIGISYDRRDFYRQTGLGGHAPIVTSRFMASQWQEVLGLVEPPPIVYPPIEPAFSKVDRPAPGSARNRVLFSGRPVPSKGIFTLLASMHLPPLYDQDYDLTAVKTVSYGGGTEVIHAMLDANPEINLVGPRPTAADMAGLYAVHDTVVVPSIWEEPFGMVSVEAQQAGCRVVASNIAGLPETDCGGLLLAEPNNPKDLAEKLTEAIQLGPLTEEERTAAALKFTTKDSVDALLKVIRNRLATTM